MMAVGVACLEYVIDYGHAKNWFQSHEIMIVFSIAVLFLIFFVWRCSIQKSVININLFKNKNFILNIITMFVCTFQITGSIAYIPTLLQIIYGYPVETTGFMSAPRGISAVISAPLVQWLTGKIGQREMMSISTLLFGLACYIFSHYGSTLNENEFYFTMILQGFAMIGFFIPVLQICFVGIHESEQGDAAGIFSFFRNFANSVGISLTGTIAMQQMSILQQSMEKYVSPFANGYLTWSSNLGHLPEELKLILAKVEIEKQSLLISYLDAFYLYSNLLLMICWMPFMLKLGPDHKTTLLNVTKKILFVIKKPFMKIIIIK
jgi:DHA2 family multidrug resistance protein